MEIVKDEEPACQHYIIHQNHHKPEDHCQISDLHRTNVLQNIQINKDHNVCDQCPKVSLQETMQKKKVRAEYKVSKMCPPVLIQYRVLKTLKQQKSLKENRNGVKNSQNVCNETKNIAKNYGKAIIAFILKNKKMFRIICRVTATPYQRISEQLPELKNKLTTVAGFRKILTQYKYSECMRVVGQIFLRTRALSYIFNSKISNITAHIKYRNKFLQALKCPQNFDHIKDH